MQTHQLRQWQAGLFVFSCTFAAALWFVVNLTGRSLSRWEVLGIAGNAAAIAAAYIWVRNSSPEADLRTNGGPRVGSAIADLPPREHVGAAIADRSLPAVPVKTAIASARSQGHTGVHVPNVETGRKPFKARRVAAGAAHRPRWYGVGEALSAKGYVLRDPMVYVCDERPDEYEASCIDLSLAVGKPVRQVVCSVDSCLSYEGLSPGRRAIYLSWISSGRTGALTDIGYAYLFFYGLERRLIVDHQDSSPIFNECVRLLQTYTFSTSFDSDIGRFLAFAQARSGLATLDHQWFQAVSEKSRLTQHEDFLAVALACFHQKNVPLPTSWAMAIARRDPRSPEAPRLSAFPMNSRRTSNAGTVKSSVTASISGLPSATGSWLIARRIRRWAWIGARGPGTPKVS